MNPVSSGTRVRSQARFETGVVLRNGEQLLLTIVIPVVLLVGIGLTSVMPGSYGAPGSDRVAHALATVLTVAVIAAAFTSLAIATAFERRSGALRFLSTTPLSRRELLAAKSGATVVVTLVAGVVVTVTAAVIGWRPAVGAAWVLVPLALGTAAFAACGFALAGVLRAEGVLAVANGIFVILVLFGGVLVPPSSLPAGVSTIASLLPSGALAEGVRDAIVSGSAPSVGSLLVLVVWLALGVLVAATRFRWTA